jgi:hypothetical protein
MFFVRKELDADDPFLVHGIGVWKKDYTGHKTFLSHRRLLAPPGQ